MLRLDQAPQLLVGGLQIPCSLQNPTFELLGSFVDQALAFLLFRYVGVDRNEPAIGQRHPVNGKDDAIGPDPFVVVRGELPCPGQSIGDLQFLVPGPEFATLRVVADEVLIGRADDRELGGIVEKVEVAAIPEHQTQLTVENRNSLIDMVEPGAKQGQARLVGNVNRHGKFPDQHSRSGLQA